MSLLYNVELLCLSCEIPHLLTMTEYMTQWTILTQTTFASITGT